MINKIANANYRFDFDNRENFSSIITFFSLFYTFFPFFCHLTLCPSILDYVEDCMDSLTMRESDYRDPGAFTWWGVTLVFNVLFIIMHLYNYPEKPNYSLYYIMVFGVNLPWTLSCVRNYIVVPNTPGKEGAPANFLSISLSACI